MTDTRAAIAKPLTLRLLKRILGSSAVLILLLAAGLAGWEYNAALDTLRRQFDVIEAATADNVAVDLWVFDKAQLATHVEGLRNFRHISYVAVSETGRILVQSGVRRSEGVQERRFPLSVTHNGQRQELGELLVQANLQAAMQDAFSTALRAMAFNAVLVLLVAGLVFWLTNSMISRHLAVFAAHLNAFSLGGDNRPLALDKKPAGDELDLLASALNTMQAGLSASYGQVIAAQAEVRSMARFPQENPSPMLRAGTGGLLLTANPAGLELLGVRVGQPLTEPYAAAISRALASGGVQHFETDYGGRAFAFAARPVPAEGYVNIYGLDITERKGAENALRESEARIRALFNATSDSVILMDTEGVILAINEHGAGRRGLAPEDMVGRCIYDHLPQGNAESRRLEGQEALRANRPRTFEEQRGDFFYSITIYPILDSGGVPRQLASFSRDITAQKRSEEALRRQVLALTQPLDSPAAISFTDLFNLEDIQRIQDSFAESMDVASIITTPDGVPLTRPSNFCRLCRDVIRKTEKGLANCYASDAALGRPNAEGPTITPCLSGGLWDAGASITVGGQHLANWLIGQVRNEAQDDGAMLRYAEEIGADREEFKAALAEVPVMPTAQFNKVAKALFLMSSELSLRAYQNAQQARFIHERQQAEEEVRRNNVRLQCLVRVLQHNAESVQEFLDFSLAEALAFTGSRFGYIYHYSEERREFVLNSWSSEVMAECRVKGAPEMYQLDKTGIWGELVRQRKPIIVNDFQAAHPLKRGYPEGHVELSNFMTVPVFQGSRIVAVAGVGNKNGDYQDEDVLRFSLLMDACWQVVARLNAEHDVRSSLQEKEILLKEIHHRVKNNLQIISSLLFLQAEYVIEPQDRIMFEESQKRISAMAMVHEELYGSADLSSVAMDEYVPRLVGRVVASSDASIEAAFDVEGMRLPVTRSIPCGLVLNEMVMNAVKHAFRPGQAGRLHVSLARHDAQVELAVEDNGPGLPQGFTLESPATLGLTLMTSLARQLGGSVTAQNLEAGARFALRFPMAVL